jgi:hypothetical protein
MKPSETNIHSDCIEQRLISLKIQIHDLEKTIILKLLKDN